MLEVDEAVQSGREWFGDKNRRLALVVHSADIGAMHNLFQSPERLNGNHIRSSLAQRRFYKSTAAGKFLLLAGEVWRFISQIPVKMVSLL